MTRRRVDRRSGVDRSLRADGDTGPWPFPFDRERHERARRLLGEDTAAAYVRGATTARMIDDATHEYERASRAADLGGRPPPTGSATQRALRRLVDVQERHVMLLAGESGHDTLTLAELAVAHRRQLAGRDAPAHRPLLGLSLVLLTHQLRAAGQHADAVATGQEAVDILTRHSEVARGRDVRPALVLALDVSLMTCLATERPFHALEDLLRAAELLADICQSRPAFTTDRDDHLRIAAEAIARLQLDGAVPFAYLDLAAKLEVPFESPAAPAAGRLSHPTSARSRADELYDDALHLAASDGDGPAAAAAAGAAVAAYRGMLGGQPAERWHLTLRRLARALSRQAIILNELLGRPRDAMGPGREALALTREILRATEHADELDDLISELGVALHDLSHIAQAADLVGEHDQLAEEARRITVDSVGPAAMRALAAALHRRAAEACETTAALAATGHDMTGTVAAGVHTSGSAVAIRRSLVDDDTAQRWELANSLLAHGHLCCLDGAGQRGAQAMVDAHAAVAALPGRAARTMGAAAQAALREACATYPDITPGAGWPL